MPRRYDSAAAKRRILSVCVRLFIEKGYRGTRMADIIHAADVSSSTFQNIFHSKDGVLMELVQFMFENQFALANSLTMGNTSPALLYAVETSIQLADMGQHGLLLRLGHGIDAQRHAQKALQLAFQRKMRIAGH